MAKPPWRLHPALEKLRAQINEEYPRRNKAWDGTIGDPAHAASKSDHNPDVLGFVNAMDVTHDPASGFLAGTLAEKLRVSRDPRIKYVIWNRRIFSSTVQPWVWRPYSGANPHDHHVHISVGGDPVPWNI